jgi:uncharacterized membrane protein YkoI
MENRNWIIGSILMAICSSAVADDDHHKAKRLQKSGEIVSVEQILNKVQQSHQGRVLEVDLEEKGGRYLYEIELVDTGGEVRKFYFDAKTGEQLEDKVKD